MLDKNLWVCPIGVGETVCCLLGKAILNVIGPDVLEVAGSSQLCASQLSGCETAVHAVRELFLSGECEAVLLVDASSIFNSINRQNTLRNILNLSPALATIVINCYDINVPLFIDDVIFSAEGTTQGDPLAMILHAIGILHLICHLDVKDCSQVWYADDATTCGTLSAMTGRKNYGYGYFLNVSKSWLIVK